MPDNILQNNLLQNSMRLESAELWRHLLLRLRKKYCIGVVVDVDFNDVVVSVVVVNVAAVFNPFVFSPQIQVIPSLLHFRSIPTRNSRSSSSSLCF